MSLFNNAPFGHDAHGDSDREVYGATNGEFRIGDSRGYAFVSCLLHGGAALMLLLTSAAVSVSVLGVGCIALAWATLGLIALIDFRCSGLYRGRNAPIVLRIAERERKWRVCRRSGQWFGPAVVTGGRNLGVVVWLHLRDELGRRQTICIPADAMNPLMFRRLRVAANEALGQ